MGWNPFNHFYIHVSADTIEAQARALVASGMAAAGYTYVNVDGGWDLPTRDAAGQLQPSPARFPHGMKPVADYVHMLGLKFGMYTSVGLKNCARTSAGSYGHFTADAKLFASWGVDYVKLDWCMVPYTAFPRMSHAQVSHMLAEQMRSALDATGRPMVLDLNVDARDQPWTWARGIANMWRTGRDSNDRYASLLWNFSQNVHHDALAGPGGWNDPDMLEIGNGGMSIEEYRTQFSLWAEMAAPLIAGNDLTAMSAGVQSILTNRAVIGIDQDPLGRQGRAVVSSNGRWVLIKPLIDGSFALVLFNQTDKPQAMTTSLHALGLRPGPYTLTDLWTHETGQTIDLISATVAPHGVVMLQLAAFASGEHGLPT